MTTTPSAPSPAPRPDHGSRSAYAPPSARPTPTTQPTPSAYPTPAAVVSPALTQQYGAQQYGAQRYSGRIRGLDLARGLAIIGMIWAHVGYFPELASGLTRTLMEIPSGRSSALFAILAGVSIAILTGRNVPYVGGELRHAQLRIVGRAVMLLAFAALLGVFSSAIAIILDFYALWFILALPLVHWSAKKLAIAAAVVALVGPQLIVLFDWATNTLMLFGGGFLNEMLFVGTYPGFAYMAYVLAGMAIGRLDLRAVALRTQLLLGGVVLTIVGYGSSWLAEKLFVSTPETEFGYGEFGADVAADVSESAVPFADIASYDPTALSPWSFFTIEPHSNTTPEVLGNLGVGFAIIGLCLWLAPLARHVLYPLAAVGSMSLTAYVGHAFFLHFKDDWFFTDTYAPFLWVTGAVLAFCTVWALLPPKRGPLEWLTWKFSLWFARPPFGTQRTRLEGAAGSLTAGAHHSGVRP